MAQENSNLKICPECGAPNRLNAKVCSECGTKLENKSALPDGAMACNECGTVIPEGIDICPECGVSLRKEICSECGSKIPAGIKCCPECGYQLHTKPVKTNNRPPSESKPLENHDTENKTIFQKYWWAFAGGLVVIILGIVFIVLNQDNRPSENDITTSTDSTEVVENETANQSGYTDYTQGSTVVVLADRMWFRSSPEISNYNKIKLINLGDYVEAVSAVGEWLEVRIDGKTGYINRVFVATPDEYRLFRSVASLNVITSMETPARKALIEYCRKNGGNNVKCTSILKTVKFDNGYTAVAFRINKDGKYTTALFLVDGTGSGFLQSEQDISYVSDIDYRDGKYVMY